MTTNEVLKMARQAGLIEGVENGHPTLEAFAKLVAAKEREACAKLCSDKQYVHPYHDLATLIRARG